MSRQRLHKFMASCGIDARRRCEELIAEGRVELNGEPVLRPGTLVDPAEDEVRVDGSRIRPDPPVYLLLNKPRGVICSNRTVEGKARAVDYVPMRLQRLRLFTVGRLDVDSEGAVILTNDGELGHRVAHPRFEIEKTYRVDVTGHPGPEALARMRAGVWLSEGRTSSARVRLEKGTRARATLLVTLREGRRREVRRICARLGHEVRRLVRVSIGPVRLGRLARGRTRELTDQEVRGLRRSAQVVVRLGSTPVATRKSRLRRSQRARGGKPDASQASGRGQPRKRAQRARGGKPDASPASERGRPRKQAGRKQRRASGRRPHQRR